MRAKQKESLKTHYEYGKITVASAEFSKLYLG